MAVSSGTEWLCRPGMAADPCTASLKTTVLTASGASSLTNASVANSSKFDCFYVYPTVSTETTDNADLRVQAAETNVAIARPPVFPRFAAYWGPVYRQFTLAALTRYERDPLGMTSMMKNAEAVAYRSISAGFTDYLAHDNDGRPIVLIGHSQGASMLVLLVQHMVQDSAALRHRLVLAIILGGNVVVPTGRSEGGSFTDIPTCHAPGQPGCVIAYSSFPGEPPATSLFGRAGQGVSILAGSWPPAGNTWSAPTRLRWPGAPRCSTPISPPRASSPPPGWSSPTSTRRAARAAVGLPGSR